MNTAIKIISLVVILAAIGLAAYTIISKVGEKNGKSN